MPFELFKLNKTKPFIYIAAMPRSGSTLLSGMLTNKPHTIILSEPGFQRGLCHNLEQYKELNVDIEPLKRLRGKPKKMVATFKKSIIPQLLQSYRQLGIKECFIDNWQIYEKAAFKKIKYIVLARDPRDVMLSTLEYSDHVEWHKRMWADKPNEYIAERHNRIWNEQKKILLTKDCLKIKYEDLCLGKVPFTKIKQLCDLDFDYPINISKSIETFQWRMWEVNRHCGKITKNSVNRWKNEKNQQRLKRAHALAELMPDYCDYWCY